VWRSLKGSGYLGCCQRQRFARSFPRLWVIRVKARIFGSSTAVDEIIHRWKSVVFHRLLRDLDFLSVVHPSRAALHPCLDGPAWTCGSSRFRERTLTLLRRDQLLVVRGSCKVVSSDILRLIRGWESAPPVHDQSPLVELSATMED